MKSLSLLEMDIACLERPLSCPTITEDLILRKSIIERHMGSMKQTRGKLGDELREANGINALLILLHAIISNRDDDLMCRPEGIELVTVCLGALRDLACGNSLNRTSIGTFNVGKTTEGVDTIDHGIGIISYFIKRYHGTSWHDILKLQETYHSNTIRNDDRSEEWTESGRLELKMLTAAFGVVRNITHSTKLNCDLLHEYGMTRLLIWRLREGENNGEKSYCQKLSTKSSHLPDASKPWREASFRTASSLINMSEKCIEVAKLCSHYDDLIYLLLETWGGISIFGETNRPKKGYPVLHLGLLSILKFRLHKNSNSSDAKLEELINLLFERESVRKKAAQAREQQRIMKLKE